MADMVIDTDIDQLIADLEAFINRARSAETTCPIIIIDKNHFSHTCPACGQAAYCGMNRIEH